MKDFKKIPCRCCGSLELRRLGLLPRGLTFAGIEMSTPVPGGALFRCKSCNFGMRHPILSDSVYDGLYARSLGSHWTPPSLRSDQLEVAMQVRMRVQSGNVLDFGCGSGELLMELCDSFDLYGIEPSLNAAGVAQAKGVKILPSDAHTLSLFDGYFDVVVAVDVLEHIPEPAELMRTLGKLVKVGGYLVISSGQFGSLAWRILGPQYYYSGCFEHISFLSPDWCEEIQLPEFEVDKVIEDLRHKAPGGKSAGLWFRVVVKILLSGAEKVVSVHAGSKRRRLGPRFILGHPGMFKDHFLVAFHRTKPSG